MLNTLNRIKVDFEQWAVETNQGYDLRPNQRGLLQTYEALTTEHAWRGFCHASLRHNALIPSAPPSALAE